MEGCPEINGHYPWQGPTFRGYNQNSITQSPGFINNSLRNNNSRQLPLPPIPRETDHEYQDPGEQGDCGTFSHFRELVNNFSIHKFASSIFSLYIQFNARAIIQ